MMEIPLYFAVAISAVYERIYSLIPWNNEVLNAPLELTEVVCYN